MDSRNEVTGLLRQWAAGDRAALDSLFPLVYDELHRLAHRRLRMERRDHTLDTVGVVHEAYLRLVDSEGVDLHGRAHFLATAARAMRNLLVDHARRRNAGKRGGGERPLPLDEALDLPEEDASPFLELEESLGRLETVDARAARAVELHYFGGLSIDEIGEALGLSPSTVKRDLRFARAWLATELGPEPSQPVG
jgi:RNA polymerase sigma-70 factor, ECF subfamily